MNQDEGVIPVQIALGNTVFEGRNNVYLLDGERTVLVDTGVPDTAVERELRDALESHGVSFADVDDVFLTHWHHDHAGLAGKIQAESGATVYAHEADAPLVSGSDASVLDARTLRERKFDEWAIPQRPRQELEAYLESAMHTGRPVDVTPVVDGDTFDVNGATIEAIHLPGHAAGLLAYAFDGPDGREAFVGDAILPKYTPNVGGADLRVDRPLEQYIDSLRRVIDRGFERVWPGHR
ncbi:MAG: MBL fold metallo-hydrolase, partial [Halobacteriota archaeon]